MLQNHPCLHLYWLLSAAMIKHCDQDNVWNSLFWVPHDSRGRVHNGSCGGWPHVAITGSWEIISSTWNTKQRGQTECGGKVENCQSPTSVVCFLQQGCTTLPNSTIDWKPRVQILEPVGDSSFKPPQCPTKKKDSQLVGCRNQDEVRHLPYVCYCA